MRSERRDPDLGREQRLSETRAREVIGGMERELAGYLEQAKRAEIVDHGIKGDLWTKVIKPMIDEQLESFSMNVWDPEMNGEKFEKHQAGCRALLEIRDYIGSMAGTREALIEKAKALSAAIERATKEGLVEQGVPDG